MSYKFKIEGIVNDPFRGFDSLNHFQNICLILTNWTNL